MRVLLALLLATSAALAWDTKTRKDGAGAESWLSVYEGGSPADLLPDPAGFTRNEHAELAHLALHELGIASLFGIRTSSTGEATLTVVDLNAALARPELMDAARFGDDQSAGSVLEERLLPPPAHFAGLPDFTFTVYDWINKSTLCPPLAPGSAFASKCHVYFGGYLTVFNSSHFGTQAKHMYVHHHTIALGLAARARILREKIEARPPADAEAHVTYAREAELEALAYEGFAQHFLQDRWSIGHMWERWNGPDQKTSANFLTASLSGAIAGLIHGSEALTGLPDQMSSPRVTGMPSRAVPLPWLSVADAASYPGIGDERLLDMFDGTFGREYQLPDMPIDVGLQRTRMLDCSKAGWVEVISAFGANGRGGYGAWNATLPATSFPPVATNPACWENWAQNRSIKTGWVDDVLANAAVDTAAQLSRLALDPTTLSTAPALGVITAATLSALRSELTALTARIRERAAVDPDDTNLARGEIDSVLGVPTGNVNAFTGNPRTTPYVPEYAEPANLDDLDAADTRGRDKLAIFGLFNRAHVDYWCTNLVERLSILRGTGDPVREAACAYLADRAFKGTDPDYGGVWRERRMSAGEEIDPICRDFGVEADDAADDDLPYYLHPGYVSSPLARGAYAYRSIEAWCRKVAVIDVGPCPDQRPGGTDPAWDVAARMPLAGGLVTLRGRHFGAETGTVRVQALPAPIDLPVARWSDDEIVLDVPADRLEEGDWPLQVCPAGAPSRCTVGHAVLRVGDEQCLPPSLPGLWTLRRTDTPARDIVMAFWLLADGSVMVGSGSPARPRWAKAATWSVSGGNITIEPCPTGIIDFGYDYVAPRFRGTWRARPVTEEFGITSCFPPDEDNCPAMKGQLSTIVLRDGREFLPTTEVDTDRRNLRQRNYVPFTAPGRPNARDAAVCSSGVCRESFGVLFPHECVAERVADPASVICTEVTRYPTLTCSANGRCPEGFTCGAISTGCACVRNMTIACASTPPLCPALMFCDRSGICIDF